MNADPSPPTFSWKRAALHGLIPLGLVLVGAVITGLATRVANAEKFGEGAGQLAFVGFLVGFGVSYLGQTGRRRAAWIVGLSVPAGIAVIFVVLFLGVPSAPVLSEAEKLPLVVVEEGGQRWLRHPRLGFSLLHPGPGFTAMPAGAAIMLAAQKKVPDTQVYTYADQANGGMLTVQIVKGFGRARADLEDMMRGMKRAMVRRGGKILREDTTWDGARREAVLDAEILGGIRLRNRVTVLRLGPESTPFGVLLSAASRTPGALDRVLSSLRAK